MTCASCGSEVPRGARFCPSCGSSQIGDDQERRVVTVVFADIVGFTAVAELLDPEQVKRQVDRCFQQLTRDITSFGGVVDKIVGDEIVALFGAPVAHEDDAERAVRAALRMQERLSAMAAASESPFRMRIGVNTGEVLVGSSAAGGDYTAMGDVMNSASRLQTMAKPGHVVVGGSTYALTRDAIAYEPLGHLRARGRSGELEAWLARSAIRPPGSRTRRSSEFVGRELELDLLTAQARLAIELRQAQAVIISGDAGLGKARLAEELVALLEDDEDVLVYRGRCVPYGEANVWWPVAEMLRQIFELDLDTPSAEVKARLQAALERVEGISAPDVERFCIAILHALGYQTGLRGGSRDRNRAEVTLALTTLLESALARRPIVLLFSDMHWAGDAVWILVQNVLTHLNRERLMVVLTTRQTSESPLSTGRFGLLHLELGPLPAAAARALVAKLDAPLSAADVDHLIERSGGNPLFLEELAELLGRRAGEAASSGQSPSWHDPMAQIPDTLRGLVAARLDQLDPSARRALEIAAVMGRSGPVDHILTYLDGVLLDSEFDDAIADLVEADILTVEGPRFRFVSDLTREVAYSTITKASRARIHEKIARYLEAENAPVYRNSLVVAIADHYRAAARLAEELGVAEPRVRDDLVNKAARWLIEAGGRALDVGVAAEAEDWLTSALEFAEEADRPAVYYARAKARSHQRDVAGGRADLDQLDQLVFDDPTLRAKALVVRGDLEAKAGDLDRSVQLLTEAITQLHGLGDTAEESGALRLLGLTDMDRNDEEAARSSLELARRVAAEAGDRSQEAWALQSLARFAYRWGRLDEAGAYVDQAAELFDELEDAAGRSWTSGLQAWVAFHRGDWNTARALVAETLPETRRGGDPWAEANMMILDAAMHLWSGEAAKALEIAREAQTVAERADDFSLAVQARALEGRALISRGRVPEGLAVLEQSAVLADRAGDDETRRLATASNCAASARLGDSERAIRWAARFDGLSGASAAVVGESDLMVSLALALLQRGSPEQAEAQLAQVLDGESQPLSARTSTYALAIGAIIAAARGEVAVATDRAMRVLAGQSTYLDQLMAHLARAAVACRSDEPEAMRAAIADARAVLAGTDDRVSNLLITLVETMVERREVTWIQDQIVAAGIDPDGWRTSFSLAANVTDPVG